MRQIHDVTYNRAIDISIILLAAPQLYSMLGSEIDAKRQGRTTIGGEALKELHSQPMQGIEASVWLIDKRPTYTSKRIDGFCGMISACEVRVLRESRESVICGMGCPHAPKQVLSSVDVFVGRVRPSC